GGAALAARPALAAVVRAGLAALALGPTFAGGTGSNCETEDRQSESWPETPRKTIPVLWQGEGVIGHVAHLLPPEFTKRAGCRYGLGASLCFGTPLGGGPCEGPMLPSGAA